MENTNNEVLAITKVSDFSKYLSSSASAASNDNRAFGLWEDGQITTARCIRLWKENNRIDKNLIVDENLFITWLKSIGWWRSGVHYYG